MDYKELIDCFEPCINDNRANIRQTKEAISSVKSGDDFDKRLLSVLRNIAGAFETCEYLKNVVRHIFENSDFFADRANHQTTKAQRLKEILEKDNFIELNRQFNLGILQTYMEDILKKQLLEINIKIEENQRILHNLENTRQVRKPATTQKRESVPVNTGRFFVIENERTRLAVRYESAVELLKISKRTMEKYIPEQVIPYGKLNGLNSRNVIKKITNYTIPKNQPLYNVSYKLKNTVEKKAAMITRKENRLNILFVDQIMNSEPVEAQDLGEFAKTYDGSFKIIEV